MMYSPSYADATLNSSSITSTAYIQKRNLPWKRKKIRPAPSSTHSYNEIKIALSQSKSTENPHILTSIWASHLIIQPDQNKASSQHYLTEQKTSSPTIQNLSKSNNTSQKSSSPMDTASNSLKKPEDKGILNNKTKTTTNQLKKNLGQENQSPLHSRPQWTTSKNTIPAQHKINILHSHHTLQDSTQPKRPYPNWEKVQHHLQAWLQGLWCCIHRWMKTSISNKNWRTYISSPKDWHQMAWNSRPLLEIQQWLQVDRK